MKKPQSQTSQSQDQSPSYSSLEDSVFTVVKGKIYIGKTEIESTLRSVLRDEAENLNSSRLWEILNASVINEAYNLALIHSTDFDQVQFAKALKHWGHFMMNVIHVLSKKD